MRIIQVLTTVSFGDAVSNDALALQKALREMGYDTDIYAEHIDPRLEEGRVKKIKELSGLKKKDVVIYHLSTGTELNYAVAKYEARKILIYHNVTPPHFLAPYKPYKAKQCQYGLDGARYLADKVDYCLADSEWNRQDLLAMGYPCKIDVLPIMIAFEDYAKKPNQKIVQKFKGKGTNILFTGRVAPNKCHEDLITSFYLYKKNYNPDARLFLVGSYSGMEEYYSRLLSYVEQLGVQDVYFTGHISFEDMLAYYYAADLFLCASEHEGFCVPLVEAMYFDVPIIAYDSTAIDWTLGGSGILMPDKTPALVAGMMNRLLTDQELREDVVENQRIRLMDFDRETIQALFRQYIENFLKG